MTAHCNCAVWGSVMHPKGPERVLAHNGTEARRWKQPDSADTRSMSCGWDFAVMGRGLILAKRVTAGRGGRGFPAENDVFVGSVPSPGVKVIHVLHQCSGWRLARRLVLERSCQCGEEATAAEVCARAAAGSLLDV